MIHAAFRPGKCRTMITGRRAPTRSERSRGRRKLPPARAASGLDGRVLAQHERMGYLLADPSTNEVSPSACISITPRQSPNAAICPQCTRSPCSHRRRPRSTASQRDVVRVRRRVAPALPVLEAHVKVVGACRSATDAAPRPTELSKENPDRSIQLEFLWCDVLGLGSGARFARGQCNPELEHAQRGARSGVALEPSTVPGLHPLNATRRDFAPLACCVLV